MGRITIFTVDDDCPHCWRAKKAFKDRDVPFTEISISKHPSKRKDMLSLANSLLVPQVFLNATHLGGASEAIKVLQSWERHGSTAQETYNNLVACGADPTDPRLQPPTTIPVVDVSDVPLSVRRPEMALAVNIPPSQLKAQHSDVGTAVTTSTTSTSSTDEWESQVTDDVDAVEEEDVTESSSSSYSANIINNDDVLEQVDWYYSGATTSTMSVLETMELLKQHLPRRNLKYRLTTYRNSFKAREMIDTLMKVFAFEDRAQATSYALYLQRCPSIQLFSHVVDSHHNIQDTSKLFFRLQCDQTPQVLNSYRIWTEKATSNSSSTDPMVILKRLKRELNKILRDHTCPKKGLVDYKAARQHPDFPSLDEAMCELQRIDMTKMTYQTKLAFSINLYNTMIRYAFLKVGIPSTDVARHNFFPMVSFNVGGAILSFSNLEHGILRSNKRAPFTLSKPFSGNDERLQLAMKDIDSRIHFALNCGAASCPPVTNFTSDGIQEELRIVSQSFCGDDNNVKVDGRTLYLSKIFKWYQDDFTSMSTSSADTSPSVTLATAILPYLRGSKAAQVKDLIAGGDIKIKYNTYDWTSDAIDSLSFTAASVKPDQKGIL